MGLEVLSQQSQPPAQPTQGGLASAVSDLQQSRETLDSQLIKLQSSLAQRQNPTFDPQMLSLAKGLLKPTRTGSAFESFGNAAESMETSADKELEKQYAAQKLQMDLLEKSVGLKQQNASFAQMGDLMSPQGRPPQQAGMPQQVGQPPQAGQPQQVGQPQQAPSPMSGNGARMPVSFAQMFGDVKPFVTSRFGENRGNGQQHQATDYAVPLETPIKLPMNAKIVDKGYEKGGLGNFVKYQDASGNTHTLGHLNSVNVDKGQDATAGTVLGFSGSTGKSTGPHVHYAVADSKGNAVDSMKYFNLGQTGAEGEPSQTAGQSTQQPAGATAGGYTPPPAINGTGVQVASNGNITIPQMGNYNLDTMRPITPRDIMIAGAISPAHQKNLEVVAASQKDWRTYNLDVQKFGIQQAQLNLEGRRTAAEEARVAVDQARLKQNDFAEINFGAYGTKKVPLQVAQDYQKMLDNGGGQEDIQAFIKKNNLATIDQGRPLTEQESKTQGEGESARASKLGQKEADNISALQTGSVNANNLITLANNQISLAENNSDVFGYLNDNKFGSNVLRLIESARTGGTVIKPDELSLALKGITDPKARDVLSAFAQNTARMNLALAKLDLRGEGSVSDAERHLVTLVNGLPTDSAGILSIKATALKLAAQRDQEMHTAWRDWSKTNKHNWSDFIESKNFQTVNHKYDGLYEQERLGLQQYLNARNGVAQ